MVALSPLPSQQRIRSLMAWLAVVVWGVLIFTLSDIPSLNSGLGGYDFFLRKTAHMVEFGVLCWLLMRAVENTFENQPFSRHAAVSAILSFLYALSDEWHQSFVPGRGAHGADVMIDTLGIVIALFLLWKKKYR